MKRFVFLLILATLLAVPASAETLQFLQVGGASQNGVYVYPYYFSVNGSTELTPLTCDAYAAHIDFNEKWTVKVNTYDTLAGAMFGKLVNASNLYLEAAWLSTQFATHADAAGDIHFAIWHLFDNSVPVNANSQHWLADALAFLTSSSNEALRNQLKAGLRVYTPDPLKSDVASNPQEFLGIAAVPEPSSIALFASGLLGLGGILRRRFHV